MIGKTLGHYEILEPLGAGGMGEVFRARDTHLHRDVTIKLLPEELAADPERFARLEREAFALAALNHPNIATIHGLDREETLHVRGAAAALRSSRASLVRASGLGHNQRDPRGVKRCSGPVTAL